MTRLRRILLALGCALHLGGCAGDARESELRVFAAASLRDALGELAPIYRARTGAEVRLNFGSSGMLAVQIEQGARADVFFPAGEHEMDRLEAAGLIDISTRMDLLSNQLVVIAGAGAKELVNPDQLAGPWLERLAIANPGNVPAGRYAKAWLESIGLWSLMEARVLPQIDVRATLAAVEHGGAQAGIVYRTDAALTSGVTITYMVPLAQGPPIAYPVAVVHDGPRHTSAAAFLDFLRSPEALATFERRGFLRVGAR